MLGSQSMTYLGGKVEQGEEKSASAACARLLANDGR